MAAKHSSKKDVVSYHVLFQSQATRMFLGISNEGKVVLCIDPEPHCRFILHNISLNSINRCIKLQNAKYQSFWLQMDGPKPFALNGFGSLKSSQKSLFRYVVDLKVKKTKSNEQTNKQTNKNCVRVLSRMYVYVNFYFLFYFDRKKSHKIIV